MPENLEGSKTGKEVGVLILHDAVRALIKSISHSTSSDSSQSTILHCSNHGLGHTNGAVQSFAPPFETNFADDGWGLSVRGNVTIDDQLHAWSDRDADDREERQISDPFEMDWY